VPRKPSVTAARRPPLAEPRPLSRRAAAAVLRAGAARDIRATLIDSSYSIEPDWLYPRAIPFLEHRSAAVRWAALFALSRMTAFILAERLDDGSDLLHRLETIAWKDRDENVRAMAAATLLYMLTDALDSAHKPARRPRR
jgi:hypothetical protein